MQYDKIFEEDERNLEEAAKSIKKAMKGIGTDEQAIIRQLISYNNQQRQIIKSKYLTMYGKNLENDLEEELSGNFLDCALGLLQPQYEYEAKFLKKAIKGIGTNEKLLIEILCSKDSFEINQLKAAYRKLYNREFSTELKSEQGGDLGRVFASIVSGGRSSNRGFDLELVKKEARELYEAGEGQVGTNESEFIRILCLRSYSQLYTTFSFYQELAKHDFEVALRRELSGDLLLACLTIYKCIVNKPLYYAQLLREAMSSIGTNEADLTRIIVTRSNIDLPNIKIEYKKFFGKSLYDDVKNECSGDYANLLLAIIGKN